MVPQGGTRRSNHQGTKFDIAQDVLSSNLEKSRSREIGCCNISIALKFGRRLGSSAAEAPAKFQSNGKTLTTDLAASRLCEILGTEAQSPCAPGNIHIHQFEPSHYLNQCWNIANWTFKNKLQ